METITFDSKIKINKDTVITIGKFDGVHTGHDYVFNTLKSIAKDNNLATMVCTFVNPPLDFIDNHENDVLLTLEEKRSRFGKIGLDYLTLWSFDEHFMHISPEAFIEYLINTYKMKCFVCGDDFRFGYKRAGDIKLLKELSIKYNFELKVLDKVRDDNIIVSSTKIKELIMSGDIKEANRLLGYKYFIGGEVIGGIKLGRKMGFPTANIIPKASKVLPPFGVYHSQVEIEGLSYNGITNIGTKPTVTDDLRIIIETYIKGFEGNLYGKYINVELADFIRPEIKFDSVEKLIEQINKDLSVI